ncbi:MAG: L,D-transpeptidase family protein [Pyrinomonadaceae bacterium]|nr:L,D-transpeptidase family protein [Pyrinomonadaceae bacterium]
MSSKPLNKQRYTVSQRLEEYGEVARKRWLRAFEDALVLYPSKSIVLVGFKQEKRLDVVAEADDGGMRLIRSFVILGASGRLGPKMREGDRQVPEGIYRIELLNPNSRYHLSLRVGYPNEFDKRMAALERRGNLGGDIMIHGGDSSRGCLAVGDEAAEDLFVLAADVGLDNIKLILAPVDLRVRDMPQTDTPLPHWADELYRAIKSELAKIK